MHYSREATANRAPGQPMIFTAPECFVSAPVVENEVVAAAAGAAAPAVENVEAAAVAGGAEGGIVT